jgi:hypothetical protein
VRCIYEFEPAASRALSLSPSPRPETTHTAHLTKLVSFVGLSLSFGTSVSLSKPLFRVFAFEKTLVRVYLEVQAKLPQRGAHAHGKLRQRPGLEHQVRLGAKPLLRKVFHLGGGGGWGGGGGLTMLDLAYLQKRRIRQIYALKGSGGVEVYGRDAVGWRGGRAAV